ncbi:MAG: radical SAM family heme chaperone HemW [Lachnospiraceae bacterium]|nr:radical SAM family heme chaperone HemW [Lachnospiraceae bacterium]
MNGTIGIYVHIPFCVKKCAYCDFLSAPPCGDAQMSDYVEALCREIELRAGKKAGTEVIVTAGAATAVTTGVADAAKAAPATKTVDTVFFGGGTPSYLSKELFARIMTTLRENFDILPSAEITVECNPETVDWDKLCAYKELGVNRISFGLQSASDEELKRIGRIHSFVRFEESYALARKAGFDNINIDLISALPEQSPADWERTLVTVAKLNPEHISAYSLILEEGTPLYEKKDSFTFPTEDEDVKMYEATARILSEYGYKRYEISNYAKKGYESNHNNRYWKRKEYLGFGIGAASFVGDKRYNVISDIDEYIDILSRTAKSDVQSLITDEITLTKEEAMAEFFYLGLRRMEGVYFEDFDRVFNSEDSAKKSWEEVYGEVIGRLVKQGLLEYIKDTDNGSKENSDVDIEKMAEPLGVRLTEQGIFVSNRVFVEFVD